MTIHFSDYTGPTGFCVATEHGMLPLISVAGAAAFVGGAVQSGIGDAHDAVVVQAMVEAAVKGAPVLH